MQEKTRKQFTFRLNGAADADLRDLSAQTGRPTAAVLKDLVREALAAKRAQQAERWGPRLFGTEASPDEAA